LNLFRVVCAGNRFCGFESVVKGKGHQKEIVFGEIKLEPFLS
jgi:hypothetical protein